MLPDLQFDVFYPVKQNLRHFSRCTLSGVSEVTSDSFYEYLIVFGGVKGSLNLDALPESENDLNGEIWYLSNTFIPTNWNKLKLSNSDAPKSRFYHSASSLQFTLDFRSESLAVYIYGGLGFRKRETNSFQ